MELTHISLFSGIGGIDLAAEWAGFRTVLFVEIDPYCQKVLRKHWPDVPIIGDIKDATREKIMAYANATGFSNRSKEHRRKQTQKRKGFGGTGGQGSIPSGKARRESLSPITLITGGFPCQPVSVAGKRKGQADDRWLWPEMLRVIREVRPTWVVAENVAGLLRMGFNDCVSDLESEGYKTISFLIPACAVNAPHRRDRIFIVGHSEHTRWYASEITRSIEKRGYSSKTGENKASESKRPSKQYKDVADTIIGTKGTAHGKRSDKGRSDSKQNDRNRLGDDTGNSGKTDSDTRCLSPQVSPSRGFPTEQITDGAKWWAVEPELGRVAYGIPHRVDRLKCLGNAVVPQQIYRILRAIADIEGLTKDD